MVVSELVNRIEERKYLTVVLKEADDRLVQPGELLVWLVASRIMCGTAVEDISSAVSRWVIRQAFFERETHHTDNQRSFAVVF